MSELKRACLICEADLGACRNCAECLGAFESKKRAEHGFGCVLNRARLAVVAADRAMHMLAGGLRRPDFVIVGVTHVLVCEFDESQHKRYKAAEEHARVLELAETLTATHGRPVAFVRVNLDPYRPKAGMRVQSLYNRLVYSVKALRRYVKKVDTNVACVQKLFFDGFDHLRPPPWTALDAPRAPERVQPMRRVRMEKVPYRDPVVNAQEVAELHRLEEEHALYKKKEERHKIAEFNERLETFVARLEKLCGGDVKWPDEAVNEFQQARRRRNAKCVDGD